LSSGEESDTEKSKKRRKKEKKTNKTPEDKSKGEHEPDSWKCHFFRCRPQLVLKTCLCVFPTRRPDMADVSATSCDVGFFFCVVCRVVT